MPIGLRETSTNHPFYKPKVIRVPTGQRDTWQYNQNQPIVHSDTSLQRSDHSGAKPMLNILTHQLSALRVPTKVHTA